MKILSQLAILMFICLMAELISAALPFSFPSAILALFILLALLSLKIIRTENLEEVFNFFISNMAFFFIPAGVQIINETEILKSAFLEIVLITVISLFTTFLAAAKTVELVERLIEKKNSRKGEEA